MTNYELINENLPVIVKLINNKLIKIDMVKHVEIYESFHAMTGSHSERYEAVGEKFNLSPSWVKKIILKLNRKVK